MDAGPFVRFGPDHLAALAATPIAAALLSWAIRGDPSGGLARAARTGLAIALLAATAALFLSALRDGMPLVELLPFHLCDFAIFVAAFALIARNQVAYELLYFWALGGTLLAMITPDLVVGFPDLGCLSFFGIHGGVVVAALVLTWGFEMRPRRGAPWRAFLLTNVYAAIVGIVDALTGLNYLYLRSKPDAPTLLDRMGPWPWYILGADLLALVLFLLLDLPFRAKQERGAHEGAADREGA